MAFERLFADFADKALTGAWAELNRRISLAFSELTPSDGSTLQVTWASVGVAADNYEYAIGVDGSLRRTLIGFEWNGVAHQSDKPVQFARGLVPVRCVLSVDAPPGSPYSFSAGIIVNGSPFVSHTFGPADQTFSIEAFPGNIPAGALVSAVATRPARSGSTRCVVTLVGKPY